MQLPKQKSKANLDFPEQGLWLLFGQPKAGKTTAACTWPEPLLIECEPGGADYVEAYKVQVENLTQLDSVVSQLATEKSWPYKTIILDTVDIVADWLEETVARQFGAARLGEAKVFGADFAAHRMAVLNLVRRLSELPASIILVAHSRAVPSEGENVKTIDLPGRLARALMAAVAHIIYMDCRIMPNGSVDRRFVFLPTGLIESGSRHPVLAAAKACAPTYEAVRKLFNGPTTEEQPVKIGLPKTKS